MLLKKIGRLHVITDTVIQTRFSHLEIARLAIEGGADTIQFRDKRLSTKELLRIGEGIKRICEENGVTFIVNDRLDLALALEADGVHLGQEDMPISIARKFLGERIIGGSAGNITELLHCLEQGADYVGFGPVFQTKTKEDAGPSVGLASLREIVRLSRVPVVAIGGIGPQNAKEVLETGAYGIAVISSVVTAEDPKLAAKALMSIIEAHLGEKNYP